jgi:hypothetical protein
MIQPESFYQDNDYPDPKRKRRMWQAIESETQPRKRRFVLIADARSFAYGIAASVVLYFASVGVYNTVRDSMMKSAPADVRLDAAYRSAVRDLEDVVPEAVSQMKTGDNMKEYVDLSTMQLREIDSAIVSLRSEIREGDLSPMKQQRLRHLYSTKLKVLEEMIERGEIAL